MAKYGIFSAFLIWVGIFSAQNLLLAAPKQVHFDFDVFTYGRLHSIENGYSIFLKEKDDPKLLAEIIHIFDFTGKQTVSLDVLNQIPEATDLSILSVSVGKSGLIAASVVAVNGQDRPVSFLFTYDLSGALLNAQRLDSSMEIARLKVDDDDSIWAVGVGSGYKDPREVPMFFKFTDKGKQLQGFFPRSSFPLSERVTDEVDLPGSVLSFGVTENKVWCWFPVGKELAVFDKNGSALTKFSTGLPAPADPEFLSPDAETRIVKSVLTDSGSVVSQVVFRLKNTKTVKTYLYKRCPLTEQWEQLSHPEVESFAQTLVGVEGNDTIFTTVQGPIIHSWKSLSF